MADSADSLPSQRVNADLLPRFVGKVARLVCRPVKQTNEGWIVQTCDGGQITVELLSGEFKSQDLFYEVIGNVPNATTMKVFQVITLDADLDMELVNDTIKLMHDQRFYTKLFVDA
ncbi:replication factor A protein 3, partial [Favolaschia claudopus]